MALLNVTEKLGFKLLNTHGNTREIISTGGTILQILRLWDDKDYYHFEIANLNSLSAFPIEDVIPESVLDRIKTDDKTYVYICNSHEGFIDLVAPIYKNLVLDAGIPANKIYLGSGTPDLEKTVRQYADARNLEYINVEWVLLFEETTGHAASRLQLNGSSVLTDKVYEKRYLNFNRRWRVHRPAMVAFLKINGLLDKGYVSLGLSDDGADFTKQWNFLEAFFKSDKDMYDLLLQHKQELTNIGPMYLDTEDLVTNQVGLDKNSLFLYENSIVSLVSETTFQQFSNTHGRFLSEKIFKPIAVGHPFILIALPKSLELLKTLGYKTFHPYIDESYDDEFNDLERFKKIIKQIERISNFTDDEVRAFCKNVKDICDYNQKLIIKKSDELQLTPHFGIASADKNYIKKIMVR